MSKKVVKAADMPLPKHINQEDLEDLFETYRIQGASRNYLKQHLFQMVEVFREHMSADREQGSLKKDRKAIKDAAENIKWAAKILKARESLGEPIMKLAASENLSMMFSLDWLQRHFPGDDMLPEHESFGVALTRDRIRGRDLRSENDTRQARYYFARRKGAKLIIAALDELSEALLDGLDRTKNRGGRIRNQNRHDFLLNLVIAWFKIGRSFGRQPGLSFTTFCEAVCVYVGWPRIGIDDAATNAVKDARERGLIA